MTPTFAIALLLCSGGTNCEAVQAEPGVSYPSAELCKAAITAKAAALDEAAARRRGDGRSAAVICLQEPPRSIDEVEEAYDVLETTIVHTEPSANSSPVGVVEGGQRALVTGLVGGTNWLRVLLANGSSGFVYGDHLRKAVPRAGSEVPVAAALPPPPPPGVEFQDCPTCPVMVSVPGGGFAMGSNGGDASERPVHRVAVVPFAMGKFEVTAAEWDACAADGGCVSKPPRTEERPKNRPAMNLSWDDAAQYVQWLRKVAGKPYRLPSEAEWEYAARAGTITRYGWGDQPGTGKADCDGCGGPPHDPRSPADVAAFPANPWGLFGMQGGVAEWVEDCWHSSYRGAPSDGSAWRSPDCARHVLRGGSWKNPPADVTVSSRNFYDAGVRYPANGVRVVLGQP